MTTNTDYPTDDVNVYHWLLDAGWRQCAPFDMSGSCWEHSELNAKLDLRHGSRIPMLRTVQRFYGCGQKLSCGIRCHLPKNHETPCSCEWHQDS